MEVIAARGPVLVFFFDFSQLNSVRAMPYVIEWHRRYADLGLSVIGVQAPRFPFGADPGTVRTGIERLGVEFPVVIDDRQELWYSYGCEGWPSLFLWGRGGILQWFHFGEGDYRSTEEAIQASLGKPGADADLPEPMGAIRETDVQGIEVIAGAGGPADAAVQQYLAGRLEDAGSGCAGHDHDHGDHNCAH